ncbi:MAG TPA: 2Fe-2S iron-sulfur cluster-binding protein [Nevskiaceae bacterium]|nr:2Fe-2S iron-sulfur cluster-binding protein [Nevskiaceae bacterium]
MIKVTFLNGEKTKCVEVPEGSNLLRTSIRHQGGIPFKCGAGNCGTCKCLIEKGIENTDAIKAKERNHLKPEDFERGYRMACQTFLIGDVQVSWPKRVVPPANHGSRP